MNTPLLLKVKERILAEPKQFHMQSWFNSNRWRNIPNCGTAACIGGWAIALNWATTPRLAKEQADTMTVIEDELAENALGLNEAQGTRLFFITAWPTDLRNRYDSADDGSPERAKAAAERIDRFIASEGRI